MNIAEGRQPLAFSGYRLRASKFLMMQANSQAMFSWAHFPLCLLESERWLYLTP